MYTVLIVDDETPARSMMRLVINWQQEGFEIIGEAMNGKDALEKCRQLKPDLVITDIQMPVLNGIDFIEQAQKLSSVPHFIILSCYESFTYAQQAIKLGVCDYLIKDMLTPEQFHGVLQRILPRLDKKKLDPPIPAKTTATVLSHEYDEDFQQLKSIYPTQLVAVERRLDLLFSHLFVRNIPAAQMEIRTLYHQNFTGIAQYNYLNYINSLLFDWILNECVQKEIAYEKVFHTASIPSDVLLNSQEPEEVCESFCSWTDNLNQQLGAQPVYSSRIQKVIEYMQENYCLDIGLQSIADHFCIHKVYLARTFKTETGATLIDYLNTLRVQKAKLLLCISDYKINDIVYIVGYNNPQNFYTFFKKHVNCSPKEYRNRFMQG